MSSEFIAVAREFAKQLNAAADTLERAQSAEDAATRAERRLANAQAEHGALKETQARETADHQAAIAKRARELDEEIKRSAATLTGHKRKLDEDAETGRTQREAASRTLEKLNSEIGWARAALVDLQAQVASERARLTDLAKAL